jgi:thioesterase domain-containing protein
MDDLPDTVVPIRTTGDRAPLFCVHPVSGSAYLYLVLADRLHQEQPIYGLEAPGYDDDRPPLTSLPAMSACYTSILREHWPDRPYVLLGWSLGGVVALDMAQRLTADGATVPLVVMVDAEVPQRAPLPTEKSMQRKFMHDLMAIADTDTPELDVILAPLPDDAEPTATFDLIERSSLLPPELDAELLLHRYQIYRTHVAAIYDFEFDGVYQGPVTHIRATKTDPEYQRWGPIVRNLEEHAIVGDHHSIWTDPALTTLTAIVDSDLAGADRRLKGEG